MYRLKRLLVSSKKRLTVAFVLIVALAAFLPLILASIGNQAVARLGMGKSFREVRAEVREDFFELTRRLLKDQATIISDKLVGVVSSLSILRPLATHILEQPERYAPLSPDPILPELDAQTGQWLIPEISGFSLRLPRGKSLDEATKAKILSVELLLENLMAVRQFSVGGILFVRTYLASTEGVELFYPWNDFTQAAQRGLDPGLALARDWESAREVFQSQKTLYTTPYEDPWGVGRIVSVLVPVFGSDSAPLGILGADFHTETLLPAGEISLRGVPVKLALLNDDNELLCASKPLSPVELEALHTLYRNPSASKESKPSMFKGQSVCFLKAGSGLGTLAAIVPDEKVEALTSPFKNIFDHQKALLDRFFLGILATMALVVGVVTFAIKQRTERTLDRFLGAIERLSEGDLSARIPYKGFDELERISETLNTMAETLQSERGTLQEKNEELNLALQRIEVQQEAIIGLSVPILPILERTLLCPLVGILDSARLHQLSEQLLTMIQAQKAKHAILDLTGCPYLDTQTAKALTETLKAVRLLGAKGYVVGMRPEVVKAIVNLGVGFEGTETSMSLEVLLVRLAGRSTF